MSQKYDYSTQLFNDRHAKTGRFISLTQQESKLHANF